MTLRLVVYRPEGPEAECAARRAALAEAVWQVAEAHWPLGPEAMLLACDLSATYLRDHFLRALAQGGGAGGMLLVTPVPPQAAWAGLPEEAEAWLRRSLA